MKKVILGSLVCALMVSSMAMAHNGNGDVDSANGSIRASCMKQLFINFDGVKFGKVLGCKAISASETFQDLCFAQVSDNGHEYYVIKQFNNGKDGAWRTHSDRAETDGEVVTFFADQSDIFNKSKTIVQVNLTEGALRVKNIKPKLFGDEVLGVSDYICKK